MSEKQNIPGTDPSWGYNVPECYSNSMVSEDGRSVDTGWNFDEKDDDETTFDDLENEEFTPDKD